MNRLQVSLVASLLFSVFASESYAVAKIPGCEFQKPADNDLAGAKAVVAKLKAECIPKVARVNACIVRARLLMENVNDLTNIFVAGDPSKPLMIDAAVKGAFDGKAVDLSLWNNFASLEKDYQDSLDAVESFVTKFKVKSEAGTKYEDFMAELDKGYNISSDVIASLSLKESALLNYIDQANAALEKSADTTRPEIQWLASDACKDAEIGPVLALSQNAIEQIVKRIAKIQSFVVRSREAREHLIQYTYAAIRHEAETKYRDQALQELATLGGKIDAVLRANKLMVQFDLWTGALARDNERGSVDSIYLQYEASKRMYAIDLVTAQDFRERMILVTESFPEVAQPYLPRMDNIIAGMQKTLDKLESKGWQGNLAQQKLLAEKRVEIADRYTAECVTNLKAFLVQIPGVTTLETYRVSEGKYKSAVKSCEVKK